MVYLQVLLLFSIFTAKGGGCLTSKGDLHLCTAGIYLFVSVSLGNPFNPSDLCYCDYSFSAGVGRTGTFIAVDYMLQQGPTQRFMTIPKLVDEFRRQRINMVQTLVIQDPVT